MKTVSYASIVVSNQVTHNEQPASSWSINFANSVDPEEVAPCPLVFSQYHIVLIFEILQT